MNEETIDLLEPYFRKNDYNTITAKNVCQNMSELVKNEKKKKILNKSLNGY